MSDPEEPRPETARPRRRRFLRWGALVLVLLAAAYALRTPLLGPLVTRYLASLAREEGGTLAIGTVRGSWWGDVVLEDVEWHAPASPLRALEGGEVRVEYSLLGAARGEADWLRRVELEARRVALAPEAGAGDEAAGAPLEPPARLPAVRIALAELAVELSDGAPLAARSVELDVAAVDPETWTLSADLLSGKLTCSGGYAGGRIDARLSAAGLALAELARQAGATPAENLTGSVDLDGDARLDLARPDAGAYSLTASVSELCWRDWTRGEASAVASVEDGAISVPELLVRIGPNRLDGAGLSIALGGGAEEMLRSLAGRLDLAAEDLPALFPAVGQELPKHTVELSADVERGGRASVTGSIETPSGHAELRSGTVVLGPADGEMLSGTTLDLSLDVRFDDLSEVGRLAGREDWGGTFHGDLSVEGELLHPVGRLVARGENVRAEGFALDDVDIDAKANGERVRVTRLDLKGPSWHGKASGSWVTATGELEDVSVRLSARDRKTWFEGQPPASQTELLVTASGPPEALEGSFRIAALDPELAGVTLDELRAHGTFQGSTFQVEELGLSAEERRITSAGSAVIAADKTEVQLATLVLTSPVGEWTLQEPAAITIAPEGVSCDAFALSDGSGDASGSFGFADASTRFALTLAHFDPAPLLALFVPPDWSFGKVDGSVSGRIELAGPRVDYRLAIPELASGKGHPVWALEVEGSIADERFHLARLHGDSTALGLLEARADLPFDANVDGLLQPGEVSILIDARKLDLSAWSDWVPEPAWRCSGAGAFRADVSGTWAKLAGELMVSATGAAPVDPSLAEPGLFPLDLSLAAELGDRIVLREAELTGPGDTRGSFSGTIEIATDVAGIASDPASLLAAPVELSGELAVPDVSWAAKRVPALRRLSGELKGRGRLAGTLRDPRFSGEIDVERGELRMASAFPAVRDLTAHLALTEERWHIDSVTGEVGGARFSLNGAVDVAAEPPTIELALQGENLLLFRDEHTKLRANADLKVAGPLEHLKTTGALVLTEGRNTTSVPIFSGIAGAGIEAVEAARGGNGAAAPRGLSFEIFDEPPLSNMELDVSITCTSPFTLSNNVTRAEFRPELQLLGTGLVPILNGPVYVDPSTVSLPSGRLQIRSGLVEFRREAPFVPTLTLSASMRVKGYDIDAQVSGPYDQPEIVLSSNPPLANDQLLLLFLTGQAPTGTTNGGLGAAGTVAVYLAQDALTSLFFASDVDAGEALLDRLELTVGAEVSESGAPTARATFYLDEKPRAVGRAFYLTAELDPYDKVNYGIGILFRFR